MKNKQIIIDIGCGQKKIDGAIGIDFSPFSEADIVLDLNKEKLPFENSSVDFIYTSHALEHLTHDGFMHMINEMYRVSKPNSQIYITVPYFQNTISLANPFHNNKITFNEHTFRFFSSDKECAALEPYEYQSPTIPDWGLRYSANAELNIELKTLKIEYTYFKEYVDKTYKEKCLLRQSKLNVVENITYWLQAIKPAPNLITKSSYYTESFFNKICEQKAYLDFQLKYLNNQISLLESRKIKYDQSLGSLNTKNIPLYNRIGDLYIDDEGILYPSIDIFQRYHTLIQENQKVIDYLQKIIDNL